MLLEVGDFCRRVEVDLNGLVDSLQRLTGRTSLAERTAWQRSLPKLSILLNRPQLADYHVQFSQPAGMSLEYRLPASSSWCDAVLLGRGKQAPTAVMLELKEWDTTGDRPGSCAGLIEHQGKLVLHPSEQVKGYVEYCHFFHSTILTESARVYGCVFFTSAHDVGPYCAPPHDKLATEYPLFANYGGDIDERFPAFLGEKLVKPDYKFAERFEEGVYKQDRNFVRQIAKAIQNPLQTHFVLLDEQRRGFEYCMQQIDLLLANSEGSGKKLVVIIEGPPGSGKSVLAAHLWAGLSKDPRIKGNVVLTTTSSCQRTNWEDLFQASSRISAAKGLVKPATSYNPGLTPTWVNEQRKSGHSLFTKDWRSNLEHFAKCGKRNKVLDNSYAVSIVDEAHALIDPTVPGAEGVPPSGWSMHAGPQAWHIMRCSKMSIFLMDSEQSYRDNETTTAESIDAWASEFGADKVERISLAESQFRCGGSLKYVDWVEGLFSDKPNKLDTSWRSGAEAGKGSFIFEIVDDPQALDERLRGHISEGHTARLVAAYGRDWITKKQSAPHILPANKKDFHIPYFRNGKKQTWSCIWNYAPGQDYTLFVQAPAGSKMHDDMLCEVGCPYVVRGFDFDYEGLLWLSDLVWRKNEWRVNFKHIFETALRKTAKAARDEKRPGPATALLLRRIQRGYRILLTRAIYGVYVWFEDDETRAYVESLL